MKKLLGILMTLSLLMSVIAYTSGDSAAGATSLGGSSGGDSNAPIRIGFFTPESAAAAVADGQGAHQSAKLAVKIASDAGDIDGCKFELVAYDGGLDNTRVTNIVEKLSTADKVGAVVSGSYSGPACVAIPIFQGAGVVMVTVCVIHPDVVNAGNFIFSQSFPDSVQETVGARFTVENLKVKKTATVGVDLDSGKELSKRFKSYTKANGAKVVLEDYVAMPDNDFTPIVSKIKSLNVGMIYSTNYYAHAPEVVRQAALQGPKVPILGTRGADSWQLLQTTGEYANGLYITASVNRDDKLESTQRYIEEYEAAYKMQPDMVNTSVYDASQVLFAGSESVGIGDSAALHDYISSMKDSETVTGELLYYTKSYSTVKIVQTQQVQEGAFYGSAAIDDSKIIDPTNY